MPITIEQRAERVKHIGSSDLAAILGLDPFKTAYDVWLTKTGKVIDGESDNINGGDVKYIGNKLENGVLDFAEDHLGQITRNCPKAVDGTPIFVNTDGVIVANGEPVEAKTVGMCGPVREWWGDDGTDQVPDRVIIQAHAHMMAWKSPVCHVPAFIGGRGFAMFMVPLNSTIEHRIAEEAERFWTVNVKGDTPPANSFASLELVKLVKRVPEKITEVDASLIQDWLDSCEAAKAAKDAKEAAEAAVLTALGDAEAGEAGELGAVTYFQQTRKEYVCKASTFRVLRHKKNGL